MNILLERIIIVLQPLFTKLTIIITGVVAFFSLYMLTNIAFLLRYSTDTWRILSINVGLFIVIISVLAIVHHHQAKKRRINNKDSTADIVLSLSLLAIKHLSKKIK